jgi:2-polyprenyl-6-methoxyphenol hydroxylase-like FAD-dependent oxidoreductase
MLAQGISDAFRDAERLAEAVDAALTEPNSWDHALGEYERRRNVAALPGYEYNCELARMEPPTPDEQQLFAALRQNQEQTDRFFGVVAGTVPVAEFFALEDLQRVIAGSAG